MMRQHLWRVLWICLGAALAALLSGCDQISERAGFPDPAKVEAEGKAIGGACRHAGRGLEDCYRLNKYASKSAVYAGWKEMNEYMVKNNMQAVKPSIPDTPIMIPSLKKKKGAEEEDPEADTTKKDAHAKDAGKDADTAAPKEH